MNKHITKRSDLYLQCEQDKFGALRMERLKITLTGRSDQGRLPREKTPEPYMLSGSVSIEATGFCFFPTIWRTHSLGWFSNN